MFKHPGISPGRLGQEKIIAEGIVDAYNAMGFSAVGIAEEDLGGGLEFLQTMATRSKFDWLSANLVHKDTLSPLFKPAKIIEVGALKVAVLGLTAESATQYLGPDSKAVILPWPKVLPDLVKQYADKADMVILLSSNTLDTNEDIIQSIQGINLIITSGRRPQNLDPVLKRNTLLIQTSGKGKYQGVLDIHWHPSHEWQLGKETELISKQKNLEHMKQQTLEFERNEKESGYLTKNSGAKRAYDFMISKIPSLEEEVKLLEVEVKKEVGKEKTGSMITHRFIPLQKSMPDEPEVLKIVQRISEQVGTIEKSKQVHASAFEPFMGWQSCKKCHKNQTNVWLNSRHATSLYTLQNKKQENNRECIACHVTGIKSGDDPNALSLPPTLRQVGCEACHGPGQDHIKNYGKGAIIAKPPEGICLSCHTPEQDDNFSYPAKVKLLGCPGTSPAKE